MRPDRVIDYDRGVIFRNNPQFGMDIYMYVDTPGEYLNVHGKPVNEELAKQAGFPVDTYGKEREKRRRMAIAKDAIEKELNASGAVREVVKENGEYRLVHLGHSRYAVEDGDSNKLHPNYLTLELGEKLLEVMGGPGPKEEEKE